MQCMFYTCMHIFPWLRLVEFKDLLVNTLISFRYELHIFIVSFIALMLLLLTGNLIRRLQSVTNAAARLVFSAKRSDHFTPLLRELHWLKVPERIQFRLGVLAYRCLHNTAPAYRISRRVAATGPWCRCSTTSSLCCIHDASRTCDALFNAGWQSFPGVSCTDMERPAVWR